MMTRAGRFVAVVGPSGVGKDSVMAGLARADDRFVRCRRVITRPSEAGGEDHEAVSEAAFRQRAARGEFALWWSAHGLLYGIPREVDDWMAEGRTVLANLSRGKLDEAAGRFPGLVILSLSAPHEMLAQRLRQRGREAGEDVQARLARPQPAPPRGVALLQISNDTSLEACVRAAHEALRRALRPAAAAQP